MTNDVKIIAEFCQNHNGNFEILRKMLYDAVESGASYAKIQTIFAKDLSFRERFENGLVNDTGIAVSIRRPYREEYERLKNLELSYEQQSEFVSLCRIAGIEPLTTAFNLDSIPDIYNCEFKSIKIASYDCASIPWLKSAASCFSEVIVSTGASFLEEIESAVKTLKTTGVAYSLLHCVTIYPTPLNKMNLLRMMKLKEHTANFGLSSHPLNSIDGIKADLVAIFLGAKLIERHFTVLPETDTRDGKVSINNLQLRDIVTFSRMSKNDQLEYLVEHVPEYEECLGNADAVLSSDELLNRDYYRGRFCNRVEGKEVSNWEM
jgi:sialic acid synthase SpsE